MKIKNILLFSLLLVLMAFSVACNSDTANSTESDNSTENKVTDEEDNTSDSEAKYTLKMASPSTPSDSNTKAFFKYEELVEERSNGKIDVKVMHSGQLGGHEDYIQALQMGSIQAAEISTSVLSGIDDKFLIFSMPYIAKGMDHEVEVIKNGVGEKLSNALEEKTGIKIMGWMVRGPRNVYSSKGPIKTAEDFEGLKIRVMQSNAMVKAMELLGAKPVPIAADERYMALQTGVVDAAENSVALVLTEKEYEVTDYVSFTEHFITPNVIVLDTKFLNKLPEDLQKVVLDAGKEAAEFAIKEEKRQMAGAVEKLKEKGMKINEIDDKSSFVEKVKPLYEDYKDDIGQDLFDAFLK